MSERDIVVISAGLSTPSSTRMLADRYGLPIHAIGIGEGMDDLRPFDAAQAARAIAGAAA